MPNRKSAIKDLRQSKEKHKQNKAVVSELKTRDKKFNALLRDKKLDEAKSYLKTLIAKLDKAASKGIIHKNKVSRKKSRLTKKLTKLTSTNTA